MSTPLPSSSFFTDLAGISPRTRLGSEYCAARMGVGGLYRTAFAQALSSSAGEAQSGFQAGIVAHAAIIVALQRAQRRDGARVRLPARVRRNHEGFLLANLELRADEGTLLETVSNIRRDQPRPSHNAIVFSPF